MRAIVLATVPVAALFGAPSIEQLVVVVLLTGVARVFVDVGYRSHLPSAIGTDRVLSGNSALGFVRASGRWSGRGWEACWSLCSPPPR